MIAKYHRLPEWLRWVLFIPMSVLFTAGICEIVAWIAGHHFFIIRQAVAISSFLLFIYLLTPRWQKWFALAVLIGRMVIFAVVMAVILAHGQPMNEELWVEVGRELLGWATASLLFLGLVSRTRLRSEVKKQASGF